MQTNTPLILQYTTGDEDDRPKETTARFHADFHMKATESELSALSPSENPQEALTFGRREEFHIAALDLPVDPEEGECYCAEWAERMRSLGAAAAAISCRLREPESGSEAVFVFAADASGFQEAWYGEIIRSDEDPPRIAEWEAFQTGPGSGLMLTVRFAVGDLTSWG